MTAPKHRQRLSRAETQVPWASFAPRSETSVLSNLSVYVLWHVSPKPKSENSLMYTRISETVSKMLAGR